MDTSKFDNQAQAHLGFYRNVLTGTKIVIALITLTLIIMAMTLLN